MKIGIILSELQEVTRQNGGIGARYKLLIEEFSKFPNLDLDVLVFSDKPCRPRVGHKIRIERLSLFLPGPIRLLYRALYSKFWIKFRKFDVLLIPDWTGLGAFTPRKTALVTNVVTSLRQIHAIAGPVSQSSLSSRVSYLIQNFLERRQLRKSTRIIAISNAIAAWAREESPSAEVTVIPNAIWLGDLKMNNTRIPTDVIREKKILFIGRLEKRKGVIDFVKAANSLLQEGADFSFYLAGGNGDPEFEPSESFLRSLVEEKHHGRVHFLGPLDKSSLADAILSSYCVVTPSHWEAFGNATAEAMSLGKPVIATNGSGFDDYCKSGFNSILVEPRNSDQLAEAIKTLVEDEDLAASIAANAALIKAQLNPARISLLYLEALRGGG